MFEIKLDTSDFVRWNKKLAVAQDSLIPEALAMLLNRAVENGRNTLIQTWAGAVHVKNANFIRASLHRTWAAPENLEASVFDTLGHGHLLELSKGGVTRPQRAMLATDQPD